MGIVDLVARMSAKVCQDLITAGYVAATLTISNVSNATPIQVTTTTPHLLVTASVVFVSGVTGTTSANDFWNITTVDPFNFTLNGSVGNAAYVSGGTAQTALVLGQILLGRQWTRQNHARPRIIMIPMTGEGAPADKYAVAEDGVAYSPEQIAAMQAPTVMNAMDSYEVQCWGGGPTPNSATDFDYTIALRNEVIFAADSMLRGNVKWSAGRWVDQLPSSTEDMKLGHLYVFTLTLEAAITQLVPASYVAAGAQIKVYSLPAGGTPPGELALQINIP
jgi:hypothetical protein